MIKLLLAVLVLFANRNKSESQRRLLQLWQYPSVPRPDPGTIPSPQPAPLPVPAPVPVPVPVPAPPAPSPSTPSIFMPAVPSAKPPAVVPGAPSAPPKPVETLPPKPTLPPIGTELKCDQPSVCANQMANIESPPTGFKLECSAPESCVGSRFNILYKEKPQIQSTETTLDLIKISMGAFKGSVMTIDNRMQAKVVVNSIECGSGHCEDATFIFKNNVDYLEIKCDEITGCGRNCMVVDKGGSSLPCDQIMTV